MIKPDQLMDELRNAGIAAELVASNGTVCMGGVDITSRPDVAAVIAAHEPIETPQTEIVFELPLRAPSITVDDIFVESRKIKDDPDEAFAEALAEASKAKGQAKSLDLIARSSAKMLEKLQAQVKELEKRVKKLEK